MTYKYFNTVRMDQQCSVEIIEVKNEHVDCNHRILQLFSHSNCSRNAQICEKECSAQKRHDFPIYLHQRTSVDDFRQKFINLQQPCEQSAKFYVNQLDEIQKKAWKKIADKKIECLKDIEEIKKAIMINTYADLNTAFPNLYEKWKGERFDTLSCKEVFWVIKSKRGFHNLKQSQINKKLAGIIKKFEDCKDVPKSYTSAANIFSKEKAKMSKVMAKTGEPVIKVKNTIALQRPDYSEDKYGKLNKEVEQMRLKKKELEESIRYLTDQKSKLTGQITNIVYMKRQKEKKLKIEPQLYEIQIPFFFSMERSIAAQSRSDSSISNEQFQVEIKPYMSPISNPKQGDLLNNNEENLNGKEEKSIKSTIMRQSAKLPQNHDQKGIENSINQEEIVQKEADNQNGGEQGQQEGQIRNQQRKDKEVPEENSEEEEINAQQPQNFEKQNIPQGPKVKIQSDPYEGFQPWRNKELVEQMKKFGRSQPECLKVENIDILKSFAYVHLNPPKLKISQNIKKVLNGQISFIRRAEELFDIQLKRKKELLERTPQKS